MHSNAKDALHSIETQSSLLKKYEEKFITIETSDRADENKIELIVSDNGLGIPQELLAVIFDPFFTTKQTGKGTGLGLSISKNIVESFKGEIFAESDLNIGSKFFMRFPSLNLEKNLSKNR